MNSKGVAYSNENKPTDELLSVCGSNFTDLINKELSIVTFGVVSILLEVQKLELLG